jgi:hypothetical protein
VIKTSAHGAGSFSGAIARCSPSIGHGIWSDGTDRRRSARLLGGSVLVLLCYIPRRSQLNGDDAEGKSGTND